MATRAYHKPLLIRFNSSDREELNKWVAAARKHGEHGDLWPAGKCWEIYHNIIMWHMWTHHNHPVPYPLVA